MALKQLVQNTTYEAGRTATFVTGKNASMSLATGALTGMGGSLSVITALGAVGALSAGLTQIDYQHKNRRLAALYRDEIGAALGKPPRNVTEKDLQIVAKGDAKNGIEANQTIAQALRKNRRQRNLGVVLSVVASMASFGLMMTAMSFGMFDGMVANETAKFIAEGVGGLLTYNAIKAPLHWLGNKIFDVDARTTNDRIKSLVRDREKGRHITREQLFSVFVAANPDLADRIHADYGRSFERLDVAAKHEAVERIGEMVNLSQLTDDINHGKVHITELAFAVEGKESGIGRGEKDVSARGGVLGAIKAGWRGLADYVKTGDRRVPSEKPMQAPLVARESAQEALQEKSGVSFVNRLGRAPLTTDMGHVERLEQSRGDQFAPQR